MKTIVFILTVLIFVCCGEDNSVEPNVDYREVQFDLQWGFEDKSVSVIIDNTNHFSALLSSSVPFAGPQASFNILLKKGEHRINIFGSAVNNIYETFSDTTVISIGNSQEYFVGLSLYGDNVVAEVQDSTFSYF